MTTTIVFLCGGLEPGCDGVGDYTRLLAQSCAQRGITCIVIALKDSFVSKNPKRAPYVKPNSVTLLRFRDVFESSESRQLFQNFVCASAPTWVSLQFVPYSFHKRGVPRQLTVLLKPLVRVCPFHFMFHEIWIGLGPKPRWTQKLTGTLQRLCIQNLMTCIRPSVVHTHAPFYQSKLHSIGSSAHILPLFSSILPPDTDKTYDWFYPTLEKLCPAFNRTIRDQFWLFGIFGSLHPEWPPYPLYEYILSACKLHKKKALILHGGRMGSGQAIWQSLPSQDPLYTAILGPLLSSEAWAFFKNLDFGIATSPYHLISKSASAVAMLEAGLPVIVNRIEYPLEHPYLPSEHPSPQLIPMQANLAECLPSYVRQAPHYSVERITDDFLKALQLAT